MNPQRAALLRALQIVDLAVVASAFVLAVGLAAPGPRSWLAIFEMRVSVGNLLFLGAYLGYWHLVLRGFGLYGSYRLSPSSREWRDLGAAVLLGSVPLWPAADLLHFSYATPHFFACFVLFGLIGLGIERRLFRILARSMRRHGRNLRHAIILGVGDEAFDMASRLARRADLGYRIVEIVEVDRRRSRHNDEMLARIATVIDTQPIDEVFVAAPLDAAQPLIRAVLGLCEERGIIVRLLSSVVDLMLARAQIDEIDGRPVISLFTGPPDSIWLVLKRVLDFTVSLVVLLVLSPLLVGLAIAIRLDSPGPVLFTQDRVGLNGRRFRFHKFRTMVADAEQQQPALEKLNEADGPVFKIRNDPRVTRVGRWVRRLSIDELPQLLNVLKGDMSLVGPRPLPVRDVSRMDVRAHKRRFSVKPGITCLWQVNGREPQFEDWIRTDMEYIDNWSLGLDVKILLKTIPAVLTGRGAY